MLFSFWPAGRPLAEVFPSETNLTVNTVPSEIGAGQWRPVQFISINYEPFDWTAASAYLAVRNDNAGLLGISSLELPSWMTVGYIRQWTFTGVLRAPEEPQEGDLELQMSDAAGEPLGLPLLVRVRVKPASRLVGEGLKLESATLSPGGRGKMRFTVRNAGEAAAPRQLVQLWASPDPLFWTTRQTSKFGWQLAANKTGLNPGTRSGAAMAYDYWGGLMVLFGGSRDKLLDDGTWVYAPPEVTSAPGWRQLDIPGPPPREGHAMAWDSKRGRVILFGGQGAQGPLGDTWEYTRAAGWRQLESGGPSPRAWSAMAYDPLRDRMMLYGGWDDRQVFSGLWEYSPETGWVRVTGSTAPPGRGKCGMVYDSKRRRLVIYGGRGYGLTGDMWSWTAADGWKAIPAGSIPAREGHAMIYDPKRDCILSFGGWDGDYRGETWEWREGLGWRKAPVLGPTTRAQMAAAYNIRAGKMMIFGGWDSYHLGDSWELLCGGDDTLLGEQWVEALEPGASRSYAVAVDAARLGVPTRLRPGSYYVGLITDAQGTVPGEVRAEDAWIFPQRLKVLAASRAQGWTMYE